MDLKSGVHLEVELEFEPKSYIVIVEKNEWQNVKIPGFRAGEMRAWFPVLPFLRGVLKSISSSGANKLDLLFI